MPTDLKALLCPNQGTEVEPAAAFKISSTTMWERRFRGIYRTQKAGQGKTRNRNEDAGILADKLLGTRYRPVLPDLADTVLNEKMPDDVKPHARHLPAFGRIEMIDAFIQHNRSDDM